MHEIKEVDKMTKEEAIILLRANVMVACDTSDKVGYGTPLNKAIEQALKMAIKALEQEPCEYAIDKEAVFDILRRHHREAGRDVDGDIVPGDYTEGIYDEIKALPSVTPTHKKGKWENLDSYHYYNDGEIETAELRCSCCNEIVEWDIESPHKPYYCENCGAENIGMVVQE